jgi:hypothetical protein
MREINVKERAFVAALCDGKSNAEAYRIAFNRPDLPASQASSAAARILNKPQVKSFYEIEKKRLDAEMHNKSLWSRERGIKELLWVINVSKEALKGEKDSKKEKAKDKDSNAESKDDDNKIQAATAINAIIKCVELLDKMMGGESEYDKSLARMLTDLDPDMIKEDPYQYCAAGFKDE